MFLIYIILVIYDYDIQEKANCFKVFEREAREFLIISHFHVSIMSEEYHPHRSLIPQKQKKILEYKLDYDENLTRASRSNTALTNSFKHTDQLTQKHTNQLKSHSRTH